MVNDQQDSVDSRLQSWVLTLVNLPLFNIVTDLWKIGRKVVRGLSTEGMYEVITYESTLELKDIKGEKAIFHKREVIKYLQDYILTYQDQAWGDGEILIGYHCSPGTPVDRYRAGYKTHILISLREVKNKGDIDEFNIEWTIRKGFLLRKGFWATEISHRTRKVITKIIFPKNRPPVRTSIHEKNRQRSQILVKDALVKLPDGRWLLTWERIQPKLYEQFILNWEW
jgi:hypothetical protein